MIATLGYVTLIATIEGSNKKFGFIGNYIPIVQNHIKMPDMNYTRIDYFQIQFDIFFGFINPETSTYIFEIPIFGR